MKYRFKIEQYHIDRAVDARERLYKQGRLDVTTTCPVAQCLKELVCDDVVIGIRDVYFNDILVTLDKRGQQYTKTKISQWHILKPGVIAINT